MAARFGDDLDAALDKPLALSKMAMLPAGLVSGRHRRKWR
jgi:hypothetical protein